MDDFGMHLFERPLTFQGRWHQASKPAAVCEREFRVLVINASGTMAKEITHELQLAIPGCSIVFAPTLALARAVILGRSIDLVVSNQILADGNVASLEHVLRKRERRPDLIVIGGPSRTLSSSLEEAGYTLTSSRNLSNRPRPKGTLVPPMRQVKKAIAIPAPPRIADDSAIEQLGADLRNDLNNPLQEIVAMTFVARSESRTPAGAISPKTTQALEAIDRAAKNLATLVRGLEERIRTVVQSDEQVPAGGAWTADRQTR